MIVIDFNQTAISNLMMELQGRTDVEINVPLVRHMIVNALRSYKVKFGKEYGEMVIACDNRHYWRKQYFQYYKANRKKDRDASGFDWAAIFEALTLIREEIKSVFPYRVVDVEGAEADDVIATLAKWSQTNDLNENGIIEEPKKFLVMSGDHDFIQLQMYKNVSQYSPIHKKFVKAEIPPAKYVMEHIFKGDKGDGIPNILSADDSLVNGVRQKPIRQTKMDEWYADPTTMPQTDDFKANFQRNKVLVDFREIPKDVEDSIINNFVNQPKKDKSQLLNYFIKHKMKLLMDDLDQF